MYKIKRCACACVWQVCGWAIKKAKAAEIGCEREQSTEKAEKLSVATIAAYPDYRDVQLIISLITEFSQRFQDFSVIEKEIRVFLPPFLVDAAEVEERLQLELTEMQCDNSLENQQQLLSLPDFYQSLEKGKFPCKKNEESVWLNIYIWANIFCVYSVFTSQPAIPQSKAQHRCSRWVQCCSHYRWVKNIIHSNHASISTITYIF